MFNTSHTISNVYSTPYDSTAHLVHTNARHWYVLRATLHREQKAASILADHGIHAYVAQRYRRKRKGDKVIRQLENFIPNILFAYLSPRQFETIFSSSGAHALPLARQLSFVSYCYDTSYRNAEGKAQPLVIPDEEMRSFMLATATHEEDVMVLPQSQYPKDNMDEVQVTGGKYKGLCGRMMTNAAGHRHILVPLTNLITLRMPPIRDFDIHHITDDEQ